MGLVPTLLGVLLAASPVGDPLLDPELLDQFPEPNTPHYNFLKAQVLRCLGDGARLASPFDLDLGGRRYRFDGRTLALQGSDADGQVVLGLLGAVKDFAPATRQVLDGFMDRFAKEKVDLVVLNGDLAASEREIAQVLLYVAKRGWPVLALIGNTEGRAAFNRAVLGALKVAPNILNFDIVRRIDLGGLSLVSLPGYLDRRFIHQSGGCTYKSEDVAALTGLLSDAPGPVAIVSHGPPRGGDARALDVAVEAGNVGDPDLAAYFRDHKIAFGLFGHILEAGARAIDAAGAPVPAGKTVPNLYLNVGSANPLPWELASGETSCGMAGLFWVKDGLARYEFLHNRCR